MREQKQQRRDQNKEKIKQYYDQTKDRILEQKQQDYDQNQDRIREQKHQYREHNKDKIKQYREQNSNKCTCVCGSVVNKLNMCKHIKTETHKLFIKTMNTTSSEHEEYNGDVSTTASDTGSDTSHLDLSSMD